MKKTIIICTLALLALNSQIWAAPAKKNNNSMTADEIRRYNIRRFDIHNIYVWGGVGYSSLLHPSVSATDGLNYTGTFSVQAKGNVGGLIGLGYEYNYKHFLLSAGLELRILSGSDQLNWSNPYSVSGLEYDQTKYYYLTNSRENPLLCELTLPILFGGQWDKFYFKAGAKIGYSVVGNYQQSMDIHATISDPMAYEEWQIPMPHYNAGQYTQSQSGTNKFGLDIALSAEVGINLDRLLSANWQQNNEARQRPNRMRLAIFADYGLNNMSIQGNTTMVTVDENQLTSQSWMSSEWGTSKLNSLLVGVKFTYLLQMNKVKDEMKQNGYLAIFTYDDLSMAAVGGASIKVTNMTTKKTSKRTTNSRGYAIKREPESDYTISAQCNGFEPAAERAFYHTRDNDTVRIGLHKIVPPPAPVPVVEEIIVPEKEQPIILENLFFATNETTILPQSEASLNQLYQMLATHPEVRIRITGHTDDIGSEEDNQKLSEGRANSVRQAMIDRGIDGNRIEAEGKGESMPIDTNDTEEGRQHNRRVEFMVL